MRRVARELPGVSAEAAEGCPVCRAGAEPFLSVDTRDYWACRSCGARFLDPRQRPSPQDELAHYLHHQNDPGDPRYRRFLSKLAAK